MAFAQLSKGNLLVTGSFSGYKGPNIGGGVSSNYFVFLFDPSKVTTFSASPQVMYFISNRLSVGVIGGYNTLSAKT